MNDEGMSSEQLLCELSEWRRRDRAAGRIVSALSSDRPLDDIVLEVGSALQELIPCDRFSFGLILLNRWYFFQDGRIASKDFYWSPTPMGEGYSASRWAFLNRRPLLRRDVSKEQRFERDRWQVEELGMLSDLIVPLVADEKAVGSINFSSREPNRYDRGHLEAAQWVAGRVAPVVKLLQNRQAVEAVQGITSAVQRSLDLNEILKMILEHIRSQGYDRVRIYLYDERDDSLVGALQVGIAAYEKFEKVRHLLATDPYSRQTFLRRSAQIYRGELGAGHWEKSKDILDDPRNRHWAEIPLFVVEAGRDRAVGKIALDNEITRRPLIQEQLDRLMMYASQAAIAIRHAQLHGQIAEQVEARTAELKAANGRLQKEIAERRQTEEALRKSEGRFRQLSEASFEAIAIHDRGLLIEANERYFDLFGYSREELLGKQVISLTVAPESLELLKGQIESRSLTPYELIGLRKDGRKFPVEVLVREMEYRGQNVRIVAIRDITRRKRMERELIRLERLHALSEMSLGVSHNLNNILTGIHFPSQIIQSLTDDPEILDMAGSIVESAERAAELVMRLHRAMRGDEQEDHLKLIAVNEIVEQVVRETRPRWKDESDARGISIEVVTELEDIPLIQGTESGLHDILLNLLLNALDAMPEGGTATIATQRVENHVRLKVSDTGIGMDGETRRRVFEPFFTTKRDVGSGLGLSTAYGTVTRWGGGIEIESSPGRGTTFVVRLPAWTKRAPEGKAEEGDAHRAHRGKLLIVEDDEVICNELSRLLSEDYQVDTALDGHEALEKFAPGRYDAVLVDLVLPGMPGDRVAQQMGQEDASLATVLVTGWIFEEGDPRLSVFDFRMQKPFTPIEVEDVVAFAVKLHDRRAGETG